MGLFDWAKKKRPNKDLNRWVGLDYSQPIFSQFGTNIYASDVVLQAVNCIVKEMKKLKPIHMVRGNGSRTAAVYDSITNVLKRPNALMTTSDFIEKITWMLFANSNAFVFPVWQGDVLRELFPLNPTSVEFLTDQSDKVYITFTFSNGLVSTLPYDNIIHIRKDFATSELMGGNVMGQPDNAALLESLKLNHVLLQGIKKALETSFTINGIVKYNTYTDDGKTEAAVKKLTDALKRNEAGIMPLDMKCDFTPLSRNIQLVDETTLRFVDSKILRHFGVPLCILTGDYTKTQYEAFFQATIEPLIVSFSQAFAKALFTDRESNGYGHEIFFGHKELDFMTMTEKIQWMTLASNVGAITINEMREILGFEPYEDEKLGNTPVMSKNFGAATAVANPY